MCYKIILVSLNFGECFNLGRFGEDYDLVKITKFKTTKLKFSSGRNVSAVVATPETPN